MIGVWDGKLTLRCVWYPCTGAAADGKSLLPLMSKSFIQNSPLQELVYTWRRAFFAHPHHAYLTRCSTRSLPYVLAFFSLRRRDERTIDGQTRHYTVPLTRSAFLFATSRPPVPELSPKHAINYWSSDSLRPGVWRVALLIETSD